MKTVKMTSFIGVVRKFKNIVNFPPRIGKMVEKRQRTVRPDFVDKIRNILI